MNPAMTPQQEALTGDKNSPLSLYKKLSVGDEGILHFIYYELNQLCIANLGGVVGFGARSLLYPLLFNSCGMRPAIGRGVVIRQPKKMTLGNKILIDDYAALDVRGADGNIALGNFVSIGRFTSLVSKNALLRCADGVNIGSYCRIATQSKVEIGESTLIAAYSYIGPGNHQQGDDQKPLIAREMEIKGGVTIGRNCWIGAGSIILDGVSIGDGSVVGAQSLVKEDVPPHTLVAGTPAKIIKTLNS